MKLSIIPSDGSVYVDGISYSGLSIASPSNVHALQWEKNIGWIEYIDNIDGTKPQNQLLTELPDWALAAKVMWGKAKDAQEAVVAIQPQPITQGAQTL